jgi:hypothetical protein
VSTWFLVWILFYYSEEEKKQKEYDEFVLSVMVFDFLKYKYKERFGENRLFL